jgi:hypothetical protein
MHELSWLISALALFGAYLNARKDRRCFIVWLFTNGWWIGYDLWIGAEAQAALFTAYFGLSFYGWRTWRG